MIKWKGGRRAGGGSERTGRNWHRDPRCSRTPGPASVPRRPPARLAPEPRTCSQRLGCLWSLTKPSLFAERVACPKNSVPQPKPNKSGLFPRPQCPGAVKEKSVLAVLGRLCREREGEEGRQLFRAQEAGERQSSRRACLGHVLGPRCGPTSAFLQSGNPKYSANTGFAESLQPSRLARNSDPC